MSHDQENAVVGDPILNCRIVTVDTMNIQELLNEYPFGALWAPERSAAIRKS